LCSGGGGGQQAAEGSRCALEGKGAYHQTAEQQGGQSFHQVIFLSGPFGECIVFYRLCKKKIRTIPL